MEPTQHLCGENEDAGTSKASSLLLGHMNGSPGHIVLPLTSIRACTNLVDRSALQFRGQKFRRGFIAYFLEATTAKCRRSSPGEVLPEKAVSKHWGVSR